MYINLTNDERLSGKDYYTNLVSHRIHVTTEENTNIMNVLANLERDFGYKYIVYFRELDDHKIRLYFSNKLDWTSLYAETEYVNHCPISNFVHKYNKAIFNWNTVKANSEKQAAVINARYNRGLIYGLSCTNYYHGVREAFSLATDTYHKDLYTNTLSNIHEIRLFLADIIACANKTFTTKHIVTPMETLIEQLGNLHSTNDGKNQDVFYTDKTGKLYIRKLMSNDYLTGREAEVLKCLLYGYSAKQIAKLLDLSFRTVEGHINRIKEKLQCADKREIILTAIRHGLVKIIL